MITNVHNVFFELPSPDRLGWVGGGFGPNILSLLVLIKIRIRIKTLTLIGEK